MATTNPTLKKGVHHDILQWSVKLPAWQRDALRRIVENGPLSEQDIDELSAACRHANGCDEESVPELVPLAAEHIPTRNENAEKVTVSSISEPENVNAVDSQQSLPFAPSGLTIVFGYNGSGKSGYGRILRRACRARNKGDAILPNVMANAPDGPASAVITYALNDVEQSPEQWIDGQRAIDLLGSISFFDADCASVHVRDKNDVAFTPFGLDVLPTLGESCKAIQSKLNVEKASLESDVPKFLNSIHATGSTVVGKTLPSLKSSTKTEDLDVLASLSNAELKRLKDIPIQLASDPQKTAKELRTRAGRIASLQKTIAEGSKALSDSAIASIKSLADDAMTKAKAAKVAAKANFSNEPLSDIGEPVWRELWEAARRYSAVAIPDGEFPVTDTEDAVCVLCQQSLDADAKDRLSRFEDFVRDDSAQQAAKAKTALQNAIKTLDGLGLRNDALGEQLKDVEASGNATSVVVRQQLATLLRRLRAVQQANETDAWDFAIPGVLQETIDAKLISLIASLQAKAMEVEKSADVAERRKLESTLAELKARDWLATVLGDVKEYVSRLVDIDKLKKAIKQTKTTAITAKSKELAKEYVTDQLRDAFANEIKGMKQGTQRLNVELVPAVGQYGSTYYRVQLVGASKADIGTIVSEGEHRCIALACFLSELATEPSKSTVVFDDPVTSLDHHWRGCFAQRLVDEAAQRQVVVFTHDIVFLQDLLHGADESNASIQIQHLEVRKANSGLVEHGLPWDAKSVGDRIDKLEKDVRAAKPLYENLQHEEYKTRVEGVYGKLRATIEKVVEEQLFYRVVVRHRDYINLKELRKTAAITDDHCLRVKKLFDKCCNITDAHHRSPSRSFSVPTPADALNDLSELTSIVNAVKAEQRNV